LFFSLGERGNCDGKYEAPDENVLFHGSPKQKIELRRFYV